MFIRIEDFVEGRASVRARQEGQPLSAGRLLRRISKHLLWIALATLTAATFTGYFIPIREVVSDLVQLQLSMTTTGWLLIMAGLTYVNAGLVREKICLHACPYSRFQGVMFDRDTRTVTYDAGRGEPRANKRNADANSGDCVDCGICVQVCPTGIDIRNGLQAACIDCAACIDACDSVMDKLNRPRGLIRFASEAQLEGLRSPFMRPRLAGYGAVMLVTCSAVLYGFTGTTALLVEVRRDRGALFTRLDEHRTCNNYRVKVEGFDRAESSIRISVSGEGVFELFGPADIDLRENNATWLPYRVCGRDITAPNSTLIFNFQGEAVRASKRTTFLAKTI